MRAQLRGIEAVLADGTVVSHLAGPVKDNTGYNYPSLLAGSEGTLAVVTQARFRLVPRLRDMVTALVGLSGLEELHTLAHQAVERGFRWHALTRSVRCSRGSAPRLTRPAR